MATIVDLSHVIADGTITYPGLPGPVICDHLSREASRARYAPGNEFQIGRIDMVSNTGTYLDTPFHRYPDGDDLAGPRPGPRGRRPRARGRSPPAPRRPVPTLLDGHDDADLAGRAVLFRTGWDEHWGGDHYGDPSHPYVGVAAAERLVAAGAAVVGIDSVNIDDTRTGERPIHSLLLAAGIPIVEHLCQLDEVAGRAFAFFAVPPAVSGMGTFPVRALAVLD